jgi:cyanophycinase
MSVLRPALPATLMLFVWCSFVQAKDISGTKGALVISGGVLRSENKVWAKFAELAGGKGQSVVVLPFAHKRPQKTYERMKTQFASVGLAAKALAISPEEARSRTYEKAVRLESNIAMLREAKAIWFVSGDQAKITTALFKRNGERTPMLEAIWHAYQRGAVIGGSSAGAAIMSRIMFSDPHDSLDTLKHGIRKRDLGPGLGFLDEDWFVDTHFLRRGRFGRLLRAMRHSKVKFGVGVDEDTAVIVRNGTMEVCGYKGALVLDLTSATQDRDLHEFNMKGAKFTYLDTGAKMDMKTRRVDRSGRKIIDPNDPSQVPYFGKPDAVSDMFGPGVIYEAMIRALDGKTHEVRGVAFRLHVKDHKKKRLGFVFRVYCGADTVGWETEDEYTVVNAYVDILPMKLVSYPPYKLVKKRTRKSQGKKKGVWSRMANRP